MHKYSKSAIALSASAASASTNEDGQTVQNVAEAQQGNQNAQIMPPSTDMSPPSQSVLSMTQLTGAENTLLASESVLSNPLPSRTDASNPMSLKRKTKYAPDAHYNRIPSLSTKLGDSLTDKIFNKGYESAAEEVFQEHKEKSRKSSSLLDQAEVASPNLSPKLRGALGLRKQDSSHLNQKDVLDAINHKLDGSYHPNSLSKIIDARIKPKTAKELKVEEYHQMQNRSMAAPTNVEA